MTSATNEASLSVFHTCADSLGFVLSSKSYIKRMADSTETVPTNVAEENVIDDAEDEENKVCHSIGRVATFLAVWRVTIWTCYRKSLL